MMKQGCAGQLPEIYDGDDPRDGKGCFAQAWSVGELLRVYETIQKIEKGAC
jgi:glycogen debranching enzyme